ncbi:cystathionine gamma-synthase [Aspergillus steynii IBT 23096]|uniref:Cystathionine gamma-synthase n=1 Tax=Aspergillus steynii IBT 23096 TaxID=1392250 RepID=A0A2I2G2S3_9EURO|nr:cystathionine gamma-synthase [Aspergillus steynii IBT 23096]PLB47172.1 cystathionine gamma-synthase [Aspergillus steynii IBT 23096]
MSASSKLTVQALQLGDPYPGRQHTLLSQIPTWADMVNFGQGKPQHLAAVTHGYPRSILHPDVCHLGSRIKAKLHKGDEDHLVLLFSNPRLALSCREYMIHLLRHEKDSTENGDSIRLHSIDFKPLCLDYEDGPSKPLLHAVLFRSEASFFARAFWQRAGPGISSRLAQYCLQSFDNARIVSFRPVPGDIPRPIHHVAYETIRSRIAGLLDRAPTPPVRCKQTAPSDVFLYQSGMAAVYQVQQLLVAWRGGESAHVGFLYEPTLKVLETRGPGLWSYSLGTEADLDRLATQQDLLSQEGRPIQAIWCECPSNPLLKTVDFHRLRQLADKYDMVLIVDDSIGSFANVDMLGVADIVITSLSKVFSGKADVMAGSVILNPNSPHWAELHEQMASFYQNDLFIDDAIRLEYNSRDFLDRVARINKTTLYLIKSLAPLVSDPSSPITRLFYPSVCSSLPFYERQMRPDTEEFRPGYGGLFTIEFATVATAATFFDHLHVYKGFSFGADVSIATPYVQMTMQQGKDQAAAYGVKETIIRFSTGLEEPEEILERMNTALRAADQAWVRESGF